MGLEKIVWLINANWLFREKANGRDVFIAKTKTTAKLSDPFPEV